MPEQDLDMELDAGLEPVVVNTTYYICFLDNLFVVVVDLFVVLLHKSL